MKGLIVLFFLFIGFSSNVAFAKFNGSEVDYYLHLREQMKNGNEVAELISGTALWNAFKGVKEASALSVVLSNYKTKMIFCPPDGTDINVDSLRHDVDMFLIQHPKINNKETSLALVVALSMKEKYPCR